MVHGVGDEVRAEPYKGGKGQGPPTQAPSTSARAAGSYVAGGGYAAAFKGCSGGASPDLVGGRLQGAVRRTSRLPHLYVV